MRTSSGITVHWPSERKSLGTTSVRFNSKVSCIDKKLLFILVRALLLGVYIISSFVTVNHPRIVTVILIPTAVRRVEGSSPGVHHWLSHKSFPVTIIITIRDVLPATCSVYHQLKRSTNNDFLPSHVFQNLSVLHYN